MSQAPSSWHIDLVEPVSGVDARFRIGLDGALWAHAFSGTADARADTKAGHSDRQSTHLFYANLETRGRALA